MINELMLLAADTNGDDMLLWAFILAAAAIFLLFLELFIPSGGILALVGGATVVGSIVCFYLHSTTAGTMALIIGIVFGPVVVWFGFRWWVDSPMGRKMVLGGDEMDLNQTPEESYAASAHAQHERATTLQGLIGQTGVAETPLRPVGVVRVGDQRFDALSEHGIIDARQPIVVTEAYDNQLKVRPAKD
ncbi:MAG: hypothetical protein CMJ39_03280 [Phycisphaerae bacterium]|nr:hypothetical protein [Phycisphaerae bacterium]